MKEILAKFLGWEDPLVIHFRIFGLPWWLRHKQSACKVEDLGWIPGLGRSPRGHGNPLQYSYLENSHGQRYLADYSPWGCKESDMTEWLSSWIFHIKWFMHIHVQMSMGPLIFVKSKYRPFLKDQYFLNTMQNEMYRHLNLALNTCWLHSLEFGFTNLSNYNSDLQLWIFHSSFVNHKG